MFHAAEETFQRHDEHLLEFLSWHLIKYQEILNAAAEKLPRLKTIETQLRTQSWGRHRLTYVKATVKDGALWADWNDVRLEFQHSWAEQLGELEFSDDDDNMEYDDYADATYSPTSPLSDAN
jgi:hypothetical protein